MPLVQVIGVTAAPCRTLACLRARPGSTRSEVLRSKEPVRGSPSEVEGAQPGIHALLRARDSLEQRAQGSDRLLPVRAGQIALVFAVEPARLGECLLAARRQPDQPCAAGAAIGARLCPAA